MKIVYLLESTGLWGGVKTVLEDANRLSRRGHEVTILSRGPRPDWIELECRFETVPSFEPAVIPQADVVVGTFWTTVPYAVQCGAGAPVHYCQGYEGDNPENAASRPHIEQVYRIPTTNVVTISDHLARTVQTRFGRSSRQVRYAVDHDVMFPGIPRPATNPVRVGVVGPYDIAWKDIPTGLQACELAHRAGLDVQIVRVTNTEPRPEESQLTVPVEWHTRVQPSQMGELYRSMDVFLGSSWGDEEGFFMPAVEAMACGVPCVLTDIPCHRGYGDLQYALFVPPRSPQAMAEALVIAARHPDAGPALREHGIATARAHNFEDHVTDLESAFAEFAGLANAR